MRGSKYFLSRSRQTLSTWLALMNTRRLVAGGEGCGEDIRSSC
jgi:hypothetical protein